MKLKDIIPGYNSIVLPYHMVQVIGAGVKYGWPGKKIRVIGVTGTNGKTTTSFMIWRMLNEAGHKTGLMTTVAWGVLGMAGADSDGLHKQIEHMTTADSFTLNERMAKIIESGAEFLVLEITSHALVQFRTLGIPIEIAVMTNVTHEHLDYHKTFARYVAAKCKLFKQAKFGIINIDDDSAKMFIEAIGGKAGHGSKYITYGINKKCDLSATGVELGATGVKYSCGDINLLDDKVTHNEEQLNIETQIPGKFNVYNSLAAVAVGQKIGLTPGQIEHGLRALESVEGRMNRIDLGQKYEVIVDFAHTPDAFVKVFESVAPAYGGTREERGEKHGRIISLFGGAGRRDESTREERGLIAGKYSDIVIVTEDDSRDEEPEAIAEMFVRGSEKAGLVRGESILTEMNRKKAIELAISLAKPKDLVLILGKGHEKTILRADGAHKFEDLKVTKKAIEQREGQK